MSDSLYLGPAASGGRSYFGFNFDGPSAEPVTLGIVAERVPASSARVGARDLPFADAGYAYALLSSSRSTGIGAGLNARGVAIGFSAAFSRESLAPEGVPGTELLQAGLQSAGTARAALELLAARIEAEGLGPDRSFGVLAAGGGSFLLSDGDEAFLLEAAGRRWAWKALEGPTAISNAFAIETDYKRLDAKTRKEIAPVNERAACSDEADPGRKGQKESWRAKVEGGFFAGVLKGEFRSKVLAASLEASRAAPGFGAVVAALRSHGGRDPAKRGGFESPCLHPGAFPINLATTGSLVVEYLGPSRALLWFTGSSCPCLSIYKPLLLDKGVFTPLWTDYGLAEGKEGARGYWSNMEGWIRAERAGVFSRDPAFVAYRDGIESRIREAAERAAAQPTDAVVLEAARAAVSALVREWSAALPRRR